MKQPPSPAAAPASTLHLDDSELAPLLHKPAKRAPLTGVAMAEVSASDPDGRFAVTPAGEHRTLHCRRAASCLLVPAPGDTVMVAGPHEDALYIIAVAEQADPRQTTLAVDGALTIHSGGALALGSNTAVVTQAPHWQLTADRVDCKVGELDYQGGEVRFGVLVSRFVGRACDIVLDRLQLLTRSSLRVTEESEQVRAGQIDMQATETLRLHAKNALVTGKELVKVDAEQIHMG